MRVAVLAGGRSSEHDVSLASAQAVSEGLQAGGHEVLWVEIDRDGHWSARGERLSLTPGEGLLGADVVFPVLHGPFGEDGVTQGLLETLDVPYVGAGVAASAVCMDKVLFKDLMASAAVPQVPYAGVPDARWRRAPAEVLAELEALGLPVFVKPAHLGSSVGIVKVSQPDAIGSALDQALAHDELAIVEAMASGLEVECGVLGRSAAERAAGSAPALASEPGEILLASGSDWYDYQAKYSEGGMELLVPARLSPSARERVRELAVDTFVHAGCEGLARVDFFVAGEEVLVNELNTMPGFTPTSVYAKLLEVSGIGYPELVERLCRLGLERHEARRAYRY
ncbi:MAG TPA: D-alanine--D-alanine ligase family protein [Solirubrobacteraceae bacterium]|jgi:D-alanine-D-alanine ligase|nr:D-alanine--D-alanine ligase family protein [Solirubrobacteraceae bacterium]